MRTFIIVVLALMVLEAVGKTFLIYRRVEHRSLQHMAIDVCAGIGMIAWGCYVLGAGD